MSSSAESRTLIPLPRPVLTQAIIAANVLVYLAMGFSGVSWIEPTALDGIKWGANFGALTLGGEWWGLLTCMFVHFGAIHIALNMWCLWDLGRLSERLMGWKSLAVVYFATGISASLASLGWNPMRVSAGASGAIFGVAGALVSFLYFQKAHFDLSWAQRRLKSVGIFILYNLFFGAVRGAVDNSAHLGGLIAGLAIGAVLPHVISQSAIDQLLGATGNAPSATPAIIELGSENPASSRLALVTMASVLLLVAGASYVAHLQSSTVKYAKAVAMLRSGHEDLATAGLEKLAAADPNFLLAPEMLGDLRLQKNDPLGALLYFLQAQKIDLIDPSVKQNLALSYLGSGGYLAAKGEVPQEVAYKDDLSKANYILGAAMDLSADPASAPAPLQAAIKARPDFPEAQDALARVDIEIGKLDDARSLYADVLAHHPDDQAAIAGAALLKAAGNSKISPNALPPLAIHYGELMSKSELWPLMP
jgi:membrane associated rhomboid family serine protease/Flp pilus assembly protein TadD